MLDEPEAALSPMKLMRLMCRINELVAQRSQFIIATHSPILMTFPGAETYELNKEGICSVDYRQTEHYQMTRRFLECIWSSDVIKTVQSFCHRFHGRARIQGIETGDRRSNARNRADCGPGVIGDCQCASDDELKYAFSFQICRIAFASLCRLQ